MTPIKYNQNEVLPDADYYFVEDHAGIWLCKRRNFNEFWIVGTTIQVMKPEYYYLIFKPERVCP